MNKKAIAIRSLVVILLLAGGAGLFGIPLHKGSQRTVDTMETPAQINQSEFTVFVKQTGQPPIETGAGDAAGNEIWIQYEDGAEELLLSAMYDESPEKTIAGIHALQLSIDRKKVYFLSSAWATSEAVHVLDLATKQEKYLFPGNSLEVIRSGEYQGNLLVLQHRYYDEPDYGSFDHYYIFTDAGQELKDLGEETSGF